MLVESVRFLTPERVRYMVEVAEETRTRLSRFAGYKVTYDFTALQILDEWIDRHLRRFPHPSQATRLLWVSFLGEMFRRRHEGEWVLRERDGGLAVLCPAEGGAPYMVDVSGQVGRRIARGMSASLAWFYTVTSVELKRKP
jgi:hypothetical protein